MQKLIALVCACFLLNGCVLFKGRKVPVQQGNLITQRQVNQLNPGMSKLEVASILGHPILNSTFNDNRWDYVYTYQDDNEHMDKEHITVYFRNDRLVRYTGKLKPRIRLPYKVVKS